MNHSIRLSLLLLLPVAALAQQAETLTRVDLGKGMYFLKGRSDCSFVVGKDGVILFDTLTPGNADAIKAKIAEVTSLPIKYVVNTHSHGDHTGSNLAFGEAGIPIVAQEKTLVRLSTATVNVRGQTVDPLPEKARPTITFKDRKTLSIPGVKAVMTYEPAGHMDNDIYIWLPKQNVIVAGDLLHTNEYPYLDQNAGGTLAGNFAAMQAILKRANQDTKILPGHGSPVSKAEFKTYLDMMYRTVDQVAALIKDGKSVDDVVAAKLLANDTAVAPGGPDNRDTFVRVVYEAVKSGSVKPSK